MKALAIAIVVGIGTMASTRPADAQQTIRHVYANSVGIAAVTKNVERESNAFRAEFERRYHDVFISNWRRTDDTRAVIQAMDKALERVRYRIESGEKARYVRDDVRTAVERARQLDRLFSDPDQVLATMRGEWPELRSEINDLAALYELRGI